MAAKFFTGLPLNGPDPECVQGYGESALAARDADLVKPRRHLDHSHTSPVRGRARLLGMPSIPPVASSPAPPTRFCDESPLAGLDLR